MSQTQEQKTAVRICNLQVRRGQVKILRDLDCTIPAGKCTAVLGPNGSGKTTLTRAITGHAFITAGSMTVLGQKIGHTDIRALRRRIGVVHTATDSSGAHVSGAVVDGELSARDAVLTGFFGTVALYDRPDDHQDHRANDALEKVGLTHRRDLRFSLLSSGEQRLCLIARALVTRPRLLILDEPTSGLDPAAREAVLATVQLILDGPHPPTVLLITHHVEELPRSTALVLLLKEGRLAAAGSPKQVITDASLADLFGCKVSVRRENGRFWLSILPEAWTDLVDD